MNKKNIIGGVIGVVVIGGFLLSGNDSDEVIADDIVVKQDYIIETKSFSDFTNSYTIEKSGRIRPESEITLTSQVPGRVSSIVVKEGDNVYKGQPLIYISDTTANLGIQVEQARLSLERAKITYDSNKITLDKAVTDSELNLEKLQNNLAALKRNSGEDIKQAEDTLENAQSGESTSKSSLELQKLDNTILKSELDYENTLLSNSQTVESYRNSLKTDHNSLLIIIDDIVEYGDSLLGVTDINESDDDDFETFLGGKDRSQKLITENYLEQLIEYRKGEFSDISFTDISEEEIIERIDFLMDGYEKTKSFLNSMEQTLNSSIESEGTLSSTDISGYLTSLNTYQSSHQSYYSAMITTRSTVSTFLKTYKNSEESIAKQIDLLKQDREILKISLASGELGAEVGYEKTLTSTADSISSLEIQVKTAESQLQNAKDNRDIALQSLNNSIKSAELSLAISQKEYAKLTITAPITGIVTEVMTDVGLENGVGVQLIKVISNAKTEIEVALTSTEVERVSLGDEVQISYGDATFTGSLYSKSSLADSNLNYKVKVALEGDVSLVGDVVKTLFNIESEDTLMSLNLVRVSQGQGNEKKGEIYVIQDGEIKVKEITLGNVYGQLIEFQADFNEHTDIILSDMKNYDSEKFNLKIK